jgi:hypothetical protein
MAKLSTAQDTAIGGFAGGQFPTGTNSRTITALENNGYVTRVGEGFELTDKGLRYLGTEPSDVTTVDEITELLDAPHGTLLCDQASAYGTDAPFSVESFIDSLSREWKQDYREHNAFIWSNMSASEIKKDMRTAVPIGRAGIRAMNKR